jgi:hypothetical protein
MNIGNSLVFFLFYFLNIFLFYLVAYFGRDLFLFSSVSTTLYPHLFVIDFDDGDGGCGCIGRYYRHEIKTMGRGKDQRHACAFSLVFL